MSLFSKQTVYCMNCGIKHEVKFDVFAGIVCSFECNDELNWKKTLSIMGKEYYPRAKKNSDQSK